MKRLLIVDDSKLMRDMVAACLRPLGAVTFEFAGTGLEAIERLAIAPFDLVVLDLNMPDVGGIEVIGVRARTGPLARVADPRRDLSQRRRQSRACTRRGGLELPGQAVRATRDPDEVQRLLATDRAVS